MEASLETRLFQPLDGVWRSLGSARRQPGLLRGLEFIWDAREVWKDPVSPCPVPVPLEQSLTPPAVSGDPEDPR